jgi:hypothetical protein
MIICKNEFEFLTTTGIAMLEVLCQHLSKFRQCLIIKVMRESCK